MTDFAEASSASGLRNSVEAFSAGPWPTVRKIIEVVGWLTVIGLIAVAMTSLIGRAIFLIDAHAIENLVPEEQFNPFDIRYYQQTIATILHLLPGFLIVILGPLQFIPMVRKRWVNFHRWSGRVYILCGVTGAVTGFLIGGLNPFGGIDGTGFNEAMSTWFLSLYVLYCLFKAYSSIRKRQFGAHREWMIRSFAIMIAIATERVMLGTLLATTSIDFAVLFGATFWMAGVSNVVAGEIWIQLTRTPGSGARHWKDLDAKAVAVQ
ncbi:MAG: putative membrane protein [Porticoccaceae bacterium]